MTKPELIAKVQQLEQWLIDNPGHPDSDKVQSDLRDFSEQLVNYEHNE